MKVSVAMITYFHEAYIEEALNGVLMQETDFEYEIVIGEDASKDATPGIIAKFVERYPDKFKVTYHKENIGMMPNFIETLNACDGEYIALCEGDDFWTDKYKLQKQVDFLEDNMDFIGCFHNVLVKDERNAQHRTKPWRNYVKDVFELKDTFSITALFHTCSYVFKRSVLNIPDWFEDVQSGDMALFAITANEGKIKLIPENMAVYRKNDKGVTSNIGIIGYHESRIKLMTYFKKEFGYRYTDHLDEIINYHELEIVKLKGNGIKRVLKRIKSFFLNDR